MISKSIQYIFVAIDLDLWPQTAVLVQHYLSTKLEVFTAFEKIRGKERMEGVQHLMQSPREDRTPT